MTKKEKNKGRDATLSLHRAILAAHHVADNSNSGEFDLEGSSSDKSEKHTTKEGEVEGNEIDKKKLN